MNVLFWALVILSSVAVHAEYFIDAASKHDIVTTPKFHREQLEKDETIKADFDAKFKTTTDVATDKAVTEDKTDSQTTDIPKVKTTTHSIPLDDHTTTTETHSTTEAHKSTTGKPSNVSPVKETHWVKWIAGGLFAGIAVVMLSLYAFRFYRNRSESSYQNL